MLEKKPAHCCGLLEDLMKNTRNSLRYQKLRNRIYESYAAVAWMPLRIEALSHTSAVETASLALCAQADLEDTDAELIGAAALLHDCSKFLDNAPSKDHARLSAFKAEAILKEEECWNPTEIERIVQAIANHSKKSWIGEDFNEILKNADVLARAASGDWNEENPWVSKRLERMLDQD